MQLSQKNYLLLDHPIYALNSAMLYDVFIDVFINN